MFSISHYELSISISNIPAANAYGIYISQLIDIPEIANNESAEPNVQYWLSCSKPPLNSFTIATMTWLTVTQYLYHKWPRICFVCRNYNLVISLFTPYNQVCNKTRRDPREDQELSSLQNTRVQPQYIEGFVLLNLFCIAFCRSLLVPCLAIVLSVLRFTSLLSLNFSY